MDVRNCPRCKKLFPFINSSICPDCQLSEEEEFKRLREFIDNHPTNSLQEISKETKIPTKEITRYIREGRLKINNSSGIEIHCAKCGKKIFTGKFCESCVVSLKADISDLFDAEKKPAAKMHTKKTL